MFKHTIAAAWKKSFSLAFDAPKAMVPSISPSTIPGESNKPVGTAKLAKRICKL
jgi:hypothetical protein